MNTYSIAASAFSLGFLLAVIFAKVRAHDKENERMLPRSAPYKAERKPRKAVTKTCSSCGATFNATKADVDNWMQGKKAEIVAQCVNRIRNTIYVEGESEEDHKNAIASRVADIAKEV